MFTWITLDETKGKVPHFEVCDMNEKNLRELAEKKLVHCATQTSTISYPARLFEMKSEDLLGVDKDEFYFPEPLPKFTDGDWIAVILTDEKKIILGPMYWEYLGYFSTPRKLRIKQKMIGFIPTFGPSEKYLKDKQTIESMFQREGKSKTSAEHEVYLEKVTKQCFSFFKHFGVMKDKPLAETLKKLWISSFEKEYVKEAKYKLILKKIEDLLK